MGLLSPKWEKTGVAPIRTALEPLHWDPTYTVDRDEMPIHSQLFLAWFGDRMHPAGSPFHWKNRTHYACVDHWFVDSSALPAMAHLLDLTAGSARSVLRSYGVDLVDERMRIVTAQVLGFATVDVELGLPYGMSDRVVRCNVRMFANLMYTTFAEKGETMAGLARWLVWALYFQMRWDSPEYTTPEILQYAKADATAVSDECSSVRAGRPRSRPKGR